MAELNRLEDRCDSGDSAILQEAGTLGSCGAQAFVEVGNGEHRLQFCGHHYTKHEFTLDVKGFSVLVDDRHTINEKPMSGHADTPGQEGMA